MSAGISRTEPQPTILLKNNLESQLLSNQIEKERAFYQKIQDLITYTSTLKSTQGAQSFSLSGAQVNPAKSKTDELGLEVFKEIFGMGSPFSSIIKMTIGNYIPKETQIFSLVNTPYRDLSVKPFASSHINFSDPTVIKSYLGKKCRSDEHHASAFLIAKRTYEAKYRAIREQGAGFVFPLYPEALAYAMEFLNEDHPKNGKKIALEMGGASGDNAILLGFTDVDKVYNFDINAEEISKGERIKNRFLPPNVSKKLEFIVGDCFDILKIRPLLAQKVDLIFCRNLIHFFNLEKQIAFLELVKTILKPGGRILCSANAIYPLQKPREFYEQNPDTACFSVIDCFAASSTNPRIPNLDLYTKVSKHPKHAFVSGALELTVFKKTSDMGFGLDINNEEFNSIDHAAQKEIFNAVECNGQKILAIEQVYVKVMCFVIQAYDEQSISRLFRSRGLEVEATCVVGEDGHQINGDPFKTGRQTVIICKKPN